MGSDVGWVTRLAVFANSHLAPLWSQCLFEVALEKDGWELEEH